MKNPDTILSDMEFIAFDLETTGLHAISGHIIEIGAVRFRGNGQILAEFDELIDPESIIPSTATEINGITNEMVAGKRTIRAALPEFAEFLGDTSTMLMAHNARFDVEFLSAALSRLDYPIPSHAVIDTCPLAKQRLSLIDNKLETIGRYYRLVEIEKHRALDDSMLLKDAFLQLLNESPSMKRFEELSLAVSFHQFEKFDMVLHDPPPGFEDLWDAIAKQQPVSIAYLGGSRPGENRTITPHGIVKKQETVYISAYCHQGKCEKSFRLDRISSFRRVQ